MYQILYFSFYIISTVSSFFSETIFFYTTLTLFFYWEEFFSKESPNVSSSLFSIIGNLNPEFYKVYNFDIGDYVFEFNCIIYCYFTVFYFYILSEFIISMILDSILSYFDYKDSEFKSLSFFSIFTFFFTDNDLLFFEF